MLNAIRRWLILKLAGKSSVVLNSTIHDRGITVRGGSTDIIRGNKIIGTLIYRNAQSDY